MGSFPPLSGERGVMTGIPGSPPDLAHPPAAAASIRAARVAHDARCSVDVPALRAARRRPHRRLPPGR